MKSQLAESISHDKLNAFCHETPALVPLESVVAEISAQETTPDHVCDVGIANQCVIGTLATCKSKVARRLHTLKPCPKSRSGQRRMYPGRMKALAGSSGGNELRAIGSSKN